MQPHIFFGGGGGDGERCLELETHHAIQLVSISKMRKELEGG